MWDINIDLLKFETHPKTGTYQHSIICNGHLPVIVKPTWITASSDTLTDHNYTKNITSWSHSGIIISDVEYHFGIFHLISAKAVQYKTSVSNIDYVLPITSIYLKQTLTIHILEISWKALAQINHTITFLRVCLNIFDKCFPLCYIKPRCKLINRELVTSAKKKAKLLCKKNIKAY